MSHVSIGLSANNHPNRSKSITALSLSAASTRRSHGKKSMDKAFMPLLLDLSNAARMGELSPEDYGRVYSLTHKLNLFPEIPYLNLTDGWDFVGAAGAPSMPNWERASYFVLAPDLYAMWVTDSEFANDSHGLRASLQDFFVEDEEDMEEDSE